MKGLEQLESGEVVRPPKRRLGNKRSSAYLRASEGRARPGDSVPRAAGTVRRAAYAFNAFSAPNPRSGAFPRMRGDAYLAAR